MSRSATSSPLTTPTNSEQEVSRRRWWYRPQRPGWLWPVTLVTTLYLLVELGFNAQLLDSVGGGTLSAVTSFQSLEKWGRGLSGFALALFFWPGIFAQVQKRAGRGWAWVGVAVVTGMIMAVVYHSEKNWVDTIVDRSSPNARALAVNLGMLQTTLIDRTAHLDHLPVPDDTFQAPDGKAFLSLLPLMAFSIDDLDQRLQEQKPVLVHNLVDHRYGGVGNAFNLFAQSLNAWQDRYNRDYLSASQRYDDAINGIAHEQDNAWGRYEQRLRSHRMTPSSVPGQYAGRVRSEVRGMGVPVGSSWQPWDHAGFDQAIRQRIQREADQAFANGMAQALPNEHARVAPNLSFEAFMALPSVQTAWREALGYPTATATHPYSLPARLASGDAGISTFNERVYQPLIDQQTDDLLQRYNAEPARFAEGGDLEQLGRDSMQNMVAPPLSLGLSLMGAIGHVFKVIFLVWQVLSRWSFRTPIKKFVGIVLCIVVSVAGLGWLGSSVITATPLYQNLQAQTARHGNPSPTLPWNLLAFGLRTTIQTQRVAYPVFEAVRSTVLRGYRFGYQDGTLVPSVKDHRP